VSDSSVCVRRYALCNYTVVLYGNAMEWMILIRSLNNFWSVNPSMDASETFFFD
jgi:hypothetical protein